MNIKTISLTILLTIILTNILLGGLWVILNHTIVAIAVLALILVLSVAWFAYFIVTEIIDEIEIRKWKKELDN